jgi:methyl-accepting chemotaxis protein
MAADNQAQSSAITQISAAIGSMDKATQQNAAMVEETSAAARNLSTEVSVLTRQAARFRTGQATAQAAPTPRAAAPILVATAPKRKGFTFHAAPAPVPAPAVANGQEDWNEF